MTRLGVVKLVDMDMVFFHGGAFSFSMSHYTGEMIMEGRKMGSVTGGFCVWSWHWESLSA